MRLNLIRAGWQMKMLILVLSICAWPASADITLPKVFSDHMVLQRNSDIRVWGTAEPNDRLLIKFMEQQVNVQANTDGDWSGTIKTGAAGGPFQIEVSVVGGQPKFLITDVMVGEVWVCAGHNMSFPVRNALNPATELEQSNKYPNLRLFSVDPATSAQPRADFQQVTAWNCCSSETVKDFSATAYFFGRELSKKLDSIPIGLINISYEKTLAEAWISQNALESRPELAGLLQYWKENPDPANQNSPSAVFNAMVSPLIGYTFRGSIWYQGEANVGRGAQYRVLLQTLIEDWRHQLGGGKPFPFYFAQLAPYRYEEQPAHDLPELWDAQLRVFKNNKDVGMVVLTDSAELADIQPKNKQIVGRRLANWAVANLYQDQLPEDERDIPVSGPIYEAMAILDDKIRLTFKYSSGGLKSRDGKPLSCFTICGEDREFVPANVQIRGEALIVSAPGVSKPQAVRFAWNDSAQPNFVGANDLPASPFRTDRYPLVSEGRDF